MLVEKVSYFSQGCKVTHLQCVVIFSNDFVTNLVPSLKAEQF